ncbi:hypothetical protein TorRG33x02_324030 [Trema orientale]|uniref:Uncharacterized protein n=1 Tax=Trema orientale TaxID=63057 RepID=A0A2P5BEE4_TREOI|nr:hypothetical protein TorRG33x02_324030 [Trema orientale]
MSVSNLDQIATLLRQKPLNLYNAPHAILSSDSLQPRLWLRQGTGIDVIALTSVWILTSWSSIFQIGLHSL